jgi:signal transduction histidine kinase
VKETASNARSGRGSKQAAEARSDIEKLLQSSQKRAAQLAAVNHIARALSSTLDIDQVLATFVSQIRQVLAYDWVGLGLLNGQDQVVLRISIGQPLPAWRPSSILLEDQAPLGWASHHERALLRQDLCSGDLTPRFVDDDRLVDAGLRTDITVPLFFKEQCIGALTLASQELESYSPSDLQVLRQAGEQVAIAIENARRYEQERKRAQDLAEISKLARNVASILDVDRQLEALSRAQSLFPKGVLGIGLLEGSDVRWHTPNKSTLPHLEPLAEQVLATGQSRLWIDNPLEPAMLVVPLHIGGQTTGVMTLYGAPGETLSHAELDLLETLSAQASVTLDNAHLIEMTMRQGALLEQRANRLAHILDTSYDVLRLSPQTKDLVEQMCTIAQDALDFEVIAIYFLDEQADTLSLQAVAGPGLSEGDRRAPYSPTYPLSELRALLQPQYRISHSYYVRYDDLDAEAAPLTLFDPTSTPWRGEGYWHPQDVFLAPIETPAGEAVGYFALSQPRDNRMPSLETVQTVEIFVNQVAIALENARLFAALEERLNQARRVNELAALNRLSTTVTSSLQVDRILDAAHQEIARTLCPDVSAIWLLQPHGNTPEPNLVNHRDEKSALSVSPLVDPETLETVVRDGRSIRLDSPQAVKQGVAHGRRQPGSGDSTSTGAMLAPMSVRDQKIGVMGAFAAQGQTFDDRDLALLNSMASTVAIAIENARLYAESKAFAKELAASQAQLLQSAKLAATGRLAASIAHEINNPLQALQSCIYLIADGASPDDPNVRYANIARAELDRIARIVGRMLDFHQPATDTQEPTDLNALIENTLALVHKRLQHSHIGVRTELAPRLPAIHAVPDHIKQVLLNLVLNAMEAMPDGGTLEIRTTQATPEWIDMAIQDNGVGIEPAEIAHLFEPFYTTKPRGTGLGLSVSYDLIARHGGQILVDSAPGNGTTFTVHLPAHRESRTWNKN